MRWPLSHASVRLITPKSHCFEKDLHHTEMCCTGIECLKGHSWSGMFLVEAIRPHQLQKLISPGQQSLAWAWDVRLNQIPEEWHEVAIKFLRANGIRNGNLQLSFYWLTKEISTFIRDGKLTALRMPRGLDQVQQQTTEHLAESWKVFAVLICLKAIKAKLLTANPILKPSAIDHKQIPILLSVQALPRPQWDQTV